MSKTLLRIDASARTEASHSRALADHFQVRWQAVRPGDQWRVRDLAREPLPHIDECTIRGFYTPEEQLDAQLRAATAMSDRLIEELQAADGLLLSAPMYNFSVPSALKAYIDQIVRAGHTFGYDPERGFYGLLRTPVAYIVSAAGAVYADGLEAYDLLTGYLRLLLKFLGIEQLHFVSVQGTTTHPDGLEQSMQAARAQIEQLVAAAA